jgi:CMP-N,N'-diacetyllegionaminic acid synthase
LKVIALIPARSGSKGLLNKNIRTLGKHPLISYSIAASKACAGIDRVIVSTDSEEYASIAQRYGAETPFLRPKELASDTSTDYEFFKHTYEWFNENGSYMPDLVVHLRPTTPLREINVINEAISYMSQNSHASGLRSAHKTHLTPYKMFREDGEFMRPFLTYNNITEFYNLPRQNFDDAFIPNGYVDILRPEILLKTGLLHGPKIKLWKTPEVPDIDTALEFDIASRLVNDKNFETIMKYLNEII